MMTRSLDHASLKAHVNVPTLGDGWSAFDAGAFRRRPAQRLPAFGRVGAAVLVRVAAREVAIGLAHELGLADGAIAIAVHEAEEGILSLERLVVRQDRPRG